MQRYECYKPANIEWAPAIPAAWDTQPIRALFNERKEKNEGPKTDFILSVMKDIGVIPYDEKGNVGNKKSENIEKYKVVYPGDLVVNKMNAIIGSLGISQYHGALSQVYFVLYPKDHSRTNHKYLGYLFKVKPFQQGLIKISKGMMELRESIDFDEFKKLLLPVPSLDEQDRIVAFLDQKTAEIDAAIAKKERLIELLQEQKKAAIRRAVTLGINGNHQLLPHDLSYLKQVPSNWDIKRNKQLFFEKKGVVGKQASSYTLLSLTLNGVIPRNLDNPKGKFPAEFDTYKKVQPNDMVFCLFDVEETPRTVGLARHVGMITGAYTVVECFDPSLAGYLSYFYTALDDEKMLRPFYTGLRNVVQRNTFFGLQVPIPPENERQGIVEYIDSVIYGTAQLAEKAQQEVMSLQEFKNALVASAVTGRIKI